MKIGAMEIDVVKPRMWDLIAMAVAATGAVVSAVNLAITQTTPMSDALTLTIVLLQLAVCLGSLLILGKTAKEGTIWGNLAAVTGTFIGMSGVLLAAALWALA